jgi:hypothetical protein
MGPNLRRSRSHLDKKQYGIIRGDCTLVAILFFMNPLYGNFTLRGGEYPHAYILMVGDMKRMSEQVIKRKTNHMDRPN